MAAAFFARQWNHQACGAGRAEFLAGGYYRVHGSIEVKREPWE